MYNQSKATKQKSAQLKEYQSQILSPIIIILTILFSSISLHSSELYDKGLYLIPFPQNVQLGGDDFIINGEVIIVTDKDNSEADKFAAEELVFTLKTEWNIEAILSETGIKGSKSIVLTRNKVPESLKEQGYRITTSSDELIIQAKSEEGLFYGTQTLLQLIKKNSNGYIIPGLVIEDWPDINKRAVHYDTKHHQDKISYVEKFIRDLARYKINQLVWEWEDKLAYNSHPEIGAPGAFTTGEMQEITRYAQKYHIELIPLVQGLGHVSFILKWPQYKHLREIPASNWEFCPLKDGTYDLLFDLWEEAIEATPGSDYIHIGSDETFELCACPECNAKAEEIGRSGVYHLFVKKAAEHLKKAGRKVMVWETPMGWEHNPSPIKNFTPSKGLVLTESYNYDTPDYRHAKRSKDLGYEVYAYDPNPGIEPLFLPYKYRERNSGKMKTTGSLENSYQFLTSAAVSGVFDGMITTSWDDSGLHNQMWMLRFATAAAYSWNGSYPTLQEFENTFYKNYYGKNVMDMEELYSLLNEGAYYFSWTFERNVWHHGEIGKTHIPDMLRNDNMEYNPYWNARYQNKVEESRETLQKMERALQIIENNKRLNPKNDYDFELYRTIAELISHTCSTYLDLSSLESIITRAHNLTFTDKAMAHEQLLKAKELIESSIERRTKVYNDLVRIWEITRLPKGLSTRGKEFFHQQDRARHFANRVPDMSYLIYDEQLLNMEGYLERLKDYIRYYKEKVLDN
ncbi:putative N-acetyl-beta-hexosaminidase [Proteiniphilum saccharofermentans]|uniref:Putative N-acetyl-beta-hexosaminidase n=1 Tax=Proteiniphilum saccharofermentans TaxID=1642647 RepID=A0A1R3T3R7_9BACT|nr:beta-N-acetylhexosaminidase [Proteiniphilum saccharofermentans]SCD21850.1 putative N-acetyl-beta-hexosaminidase [Proteiniphilum saccharofermentans]